ncbi:MAG: hypothetical protein D6715_04045 [Calditrichaeota bacterium]|nr:MAG: hypothetical protein D6715_04045 [Calditrichota bacterium]
MCTEGAFLRAPLAGFSGMLPRPGAGLPKAAALRPAYFALEASPSVHADPEAGSSLAGHARRESAKGKAKTWARLPLRRNCRMRAGPLFSIRD